MNNEPIRVLIIEDDVDETGIIGSYLADVVGSAQSFNLAQAPRLSTACHLLARQDFDVILIDLVLPRSVGIEGFLKIRALKPAMPIIVLTGLQDEPLAIKAVKLGAQDYLIKGSPDCCLLKRVIHYAIEMKRLTNIIEDLLSRDRPLVRTPEPDVEPRGDGGRLKRINEDIRAGFRALEVRNHFMNKITHELRNTLAIMKIAVYCLKNETEELLTPRQTRMADTISRNVDRQVRVIDNVSDIARYQSGKFNIHFRQTDMSEIIAEVVTEFGLMGASNKLQVDVDRRLPFIKADPELISQVMRNLIDNALRHAREKVVIKASKADPDGVFISVSDDGAGVAPERLGGLFTEFVQLGWPANGGSHNGAGLGLTICKEIIKGHHGKIWVENAAGQGAKFSFTLPINDKPDNIGVRNGRVLVGSESAAAPRGAHNGG